MIRIAAVRRAILKERISPLQALPWIILVVAIATLVRAATAPWLAGVPYITFFPAVLIIAVFFGWKWTIAATLVLAVIANYLFQAPVYAFSVSPRALFGSVVFLATSGLTILTAEALRRAVREVDDFARREAALNRELQHRVKNNLAVVQALARQTAKSSPEPHSFYEAFRGRIMALSEAHEILSTGAWEACRLPELVDGALRPFYADGLIETSGPPCKLPVDSCVPLVLALHELGTNAVKHGALSLPSGRVNLVWELDGPVFHLRWREELGPPVSQPSRLGLGSRLLARQAGLDDVTVTFAPDGLVCDITISGAEPLQPAA